MEYKDTRMTEVQEILKLYRMYGMTYDLTNDNLLLEFATVMTKGINLGFDYDGTFDNFFDMLEQLYYSFDPDEEALNIDSGDCYGEVREDTENIYRHLKSIYEKVKAIKEKNNE